MNARKQRSNKQDSHADSAETRQSLAEAASAAARDAGGLDPTLLGDFLDLLARAQQAPAWDRHQQAAFEALGARAVEHGASLSKVVDLYLSAAWRSWPELPAVNAEDADTVRAAGTAVLHVVDDAVAAVAEGFASARRALVRREESLRREFVDDLLAGTTDPAGLLARADGYGIDLVGTHTVLLARADAPFHDATPVLSEVATAINAVLSNTAASSAGHLVGTRDGLLVVVLPTMDPTERAAACAAVQRAAHGMTLLAVGRHRDGPAGVAASFTDAREALELADRTGWPEPVVYADRLIVYQVLLRDRAALEELIDSVLAPLLRARGGARSLVDTVLAFCDTGGNTTRTAARLHLSPRAVTYRLSRIAELTGWDPTDPGQRYVLHTAVLGARATGWPSD